MGSSFRRHGRRTDASETGSPPAAFDGIEGSAARWFAAQDGWWEGHVDTATGEIIEFLSTSGVTLDGTRLLDLGCGDGTIALGLAHHSAAKEVLGVDLVATDEAHLAALAAAHAVAWPASLSFRESSATRLPVEDGWADVIVTWSVFEHVADVDGLLAEVRRALRADGVLFVQLWPFFGSEHGSHLWPWFDSGFVQHRLTDTEIDRHLHAVCPDPDLAASMFDLYRTCNRITVDDLGAALHRQGFYISKVELVSHTVHLPPEAQGLPLSTVAVAGVKLIAVRP
jgi:SAM-dependent methyltransferase